MEEGARSSSCLPLVPKLRLGLHSFAKRRFARFPAPFFLATPGDERKRMFRAAARPITRNPMSPSPDPQPPPVFAARTALRLAEALLIGLAAVAAFTWWDARRSARLESFAEVTAVGDKNYFGNPDPPGTPGKPIIRAENQLWVPVSFEKERRRDTQMLRAARDQSLTLYRPRKEAKPDELFVKIERNGYLRLRPQ